MQEREAEIEAEIERKAGQFADERLELGASHRERLRVVGGLERRALDLLPPLRLGAEERLLAERHAQLVLQQLAQRAERRAGGGAHALGARLCALRHHASVQPHLQDVRHLALWRRRRRALRARATGNCQYRKNK